MRCATETFDCSSAPPRTRGAAVGVGVTPAARGTAPRPPWPTLHSPKNPPPGPGRPAPSTAMVPSGLTTTGPSRHLDRALRAEDGHALEADERPVRGPREAAIPRVARPVRRLEGEEAFPVDGHVEVPARGQDDSRAEVHRRRAGHVIHCRIEDGVEGRPIDRFRTGAFALVDRRSPGSRCQRRPVELSHPRPHSAQRHVNRSSHALLPSGVSVRTTVRCASPTLRGMTGPGRPPERSRRRAAAHRWR